MKVLVLLLLVGIAAGAPASSGDEPPQIPEVLTEEWFSDQYKKYTAEHEIVNIFAPIKALKIGDEKQVPILFFVQGDYKEDETVDYKGLYSLKVKTGEATKLLDNGVDVTAQNDINKIFFAATDGIYTYNAEKNTAEKYGSVTDNIISIAKAKAEDVIYALTADKVLYKVTENGDRREKVDDVKNAQQIVLDEKDNIYFYDSEKRVFFVNENGVKKIEDLPVNPKNITLLRPLLVGPARRGIPVFIDNKLYHIYENGTVEKTYAKVVIQPTSISLGSNFGNYFGYNKSVYESLR